MRSHQADCYCFSTSSTQKTNSLLTRTGKHTWYDVKEHAFIPLHEAHSRLELLALGKRPQWLVQIRNKCGPSAAFVPPYHLDQPRPPSTDHSFQFRHTIRHLRKPDRHILDGIQQHARPPRNRQSQGSMTVNMQLERPRLERAPIQPRLVTWRRTAARSSCQSTEFRLNSSQLQRCSHAYAPQPPCILS